MKDTSKPDKRRKYDAAFRAEAVDTIAADNLLEQMNNGGGLPDSLKP